MRMSALLRESPQLGLGQGGGERDMSLRAHNRQRFE